MTYHLEFNELAQKEWDKLNPTIQDMFKKKLAKILENPHVPKQKLRQMKDCYKIKLKTVGYRLVYKVTDETIVVEVVSVGKREGEEAYNEAKKRV